MITITDKKTCCGCHGCANICPVKCISMKKDSEGFIYPEVDNERCIDCGLCEKVCPVINSANDPQDKQPAAFMAWSLDEEVRRQSSSGGLFTVLAEHILSAGGVVYGAAFDEDMKLKHICVDTEEELAKLRGSKYLQSETGDTYQQVKAQLESGTQVLFSGTPCQTEGLLAFLQKEYDNLLLVDFVCHGVPSPDVFEKYKEELEAAYGDKLTGFSFRDKTGGWNKYTYRAEFGNGVTEKGDKIKKNYSSAFVRNLSLRPSCYSCAFKKLNRVSDITLADFWGFQRLHPDLHDDKGVSLVFAHTDRAKELLSSIDDRIFIRPADFRQALAYNPSMTGSVPVPEKRELFMELYRTHGTEYALQQALKLPLLKAMRKKASDIVYSMMKK